MYDSCMQKQLAPRKTGVTTTVTVVFVILLVILGWYIWTTHANKSRGSASQQKTESFVTFSGTVTARNNGCTHDDVCTVSVDGKVIVTGSGLTADPDANVYGTTDADLRIGDKVSVKARSTDYGLTLQGCEDCYVTRGKLQR